MKTFIASASARSKQRQGGVAVIVMLALLSILLIYITANVRSLAVLQRELSLTEQRQIQRLKARSLPIVWPQADTNAVPAVAPSL
jgi:hypothetical protein